MIAVYLSPIYVGINIYLLIRICRWLCTCHALFERKDARAAVSFVYVMLASSPLISFFLPAGQGRRIVKLISNYWLGILLCLTLTVLIAELLRVPFFLMRKRKKRGNTYICCARRVRAAGAICAAAMAVLSGWGVYNARLIHVTPYEITVDKDGGNLDELNAVLVADLHLGYNIGIAHISNMVQKINEQNADLVVIAGDIFDNEYEALEDPEALAVKLREIRSKYGVYACYGNHDVDEKLLAGFTFGGRKKKESSSQMDKFLKKAGIHLLRDEAVLIADSVYLYGRPDAQKPGRGIDVRRTAEKLMETLDSSKPVLVIDHEPRELQELADAGVDVDLCGHTHAGQMFPGNLLVSLLWENPYGYLKKDGMHTIVTSGVGLFGPNMRVGTIAEICPVRIKFRRSPNPI